jgi:hypothetical protein
VVFFAGVFFAGDVAAALSGSGVVVLSLVVTVHFLPVVGRRAQVRAPIQPHPARVRRLMHLEARGTAGPAY